MPATLLIPYITMLAAFWMSESKHSAASGLAFASALVVGHPECRQHGDVRNQKRGGHQGRDEAAHVRIDTSLGTDAVQG